jgi:amino acid adenylation domain-containing protein
MTQTAAAARTDTGLIHDLFRRAAAAAPDAAALLHGGTRIRYGELDRASDALAAQLEERGVKPGTLVPVLLPRSPEWVAALLAVLKCGAGYAALDPRWPDERIGLLVRRLEAPLTVVGTGASGRVAGPSCEVGRLRTLLRDGADARRPVHTGGSGDDISTVFLTSGSSGEPKAVLSPHRASVRMFVDCDFARFDATTVMPQGSALPWDGASLELWGPLLSGGTCVLLEEPHLQPAVLRQLIAAQGVNTLFVTTSLFNVLVEEDLAGFAGLRVVMTGGEKLSVHHIRRFRERHHDISLLNAYGPVENTIFTTTHPITDADVAAGAIALGRPVPGTSVAVFDGDRECGPGRVGEICVAGAGLAAGYLGDEELTRARFVRLAPGGVPTRMYRTGDFGFLDSAGVLHFEGRRDRQVKVRGHRIEPEEIERHLSAVPGVTRGVVVPVRDGGGTVIRLAGFYTAEADSGPRPEAVLSALRGRLPGYLVPETLRRVARIPLTATGKADQSVLLALLDREPLPVADGAVQPPRDELEQAIAEVFADLLGLPEAGRDTGFFDAGGTSLDALRLCARLSERLGRPVPHSRLVSAPSVAGLAEALRAAQPAPPATSASVRGPAGFSDRAGVPLLPMQRAFWLTTVLEPETAAAHCVSVWSRAGITPEVFAAALDDVRRRHPGLRARIELGQTPTARVEQVPAPSAPRAIEDAADPSAALMARLHEPFDTERGLTLHAAYAPDPSGSGLLLGLAVHHAFYDEWSEHLVVRDLETAAAARAAGRAPEFDGPVPALADVHAALREPVTDAELERQRSYWVRRLEGAPRLERLAPPTPVRARAELDPVVVELGAAQVRRLTALARGRGAGLSHLLLAALSEGVAAVTGETDVVLGVGVAKRGGPVAAASVTCLLDAVCVRLEAGAGRGVLGGLEECRAEMVAALSHQDVSVSEAITRGGAARGRSPYDVLFVLQHHPHPTLFGGTPLPLFQATGRELIAEARPQPDGGLRWAMLSADLPAHRAAARELAAALRRIIGELGRL